VRKLDFTSRSLEFLEFTSQPLAPPPPSSSSASPLLRSSAATGRRATPPEATSCSSAAPRVASELGHRLSVPPLAFPERDTLLYRPPELPLLCRRRPPPLIAAAALPAPPPALAAPTRRPQAGRRPSFSPLAFFRALHIAPPLPELCLAITSPPSRLAPMRASPTLLCWSKTLSSFPSLHFALSCTLTSLQASECRCYSSSSPATSLSTVGRPPQLLPIHDGPSSSFAMIP
jgi:hypothetical protein